jgi:hypothetical protein
VLGLIKVLISRSLFKQILSFKRDLKKRIKYPISILARNLLYKGSSIKYKEYKV